MTSAQPSPSSSRSPTSSHAAAAAPAPIQDDDEDFFASSPPAGGMSSATRPTRSSVKRRASSVSQTGSPSGSAAGSPSPLFRGGGSDVEDNDDDDDYQPQPSPKRQRRKASPVKKKSSSRQGTPRTGSAIILDSSDEDEEEPDASGASPAPPQDDWDRRFIGTFVIPGFSLSRGANYIRQGDKVTLHRPPKVAPPPASSASSSKRPPKQTKLVFGSTSKGSGQGNGKTTSKAKEDHIIRFHNERGFEVGRIPKDVASWMSKLMDLGIASFDGFVVDCPPSLVVGSDILLELKAYLRRSAFPESLSAGISFRNDGDVTGWGHETSETVDEKHLRERKSALMKMFRACTLKPSRSNALLKSHRASDDFDVEAMAAHFDSTPRSSPVRILGSSAAANSQHQQNGDKKSSPPRASPMPASSGSAQEPIDLAGLSNGVAAAAAATTETVEDDAAVPEENDGTEVTMNELDAVYSKAQMHDTELPEVEPIEGFALTLRAYQKQALGWMISMERRLDETGGEDARELSLHPLWEEYTFPLDESDPEAATKLFEAASRTFYFNPYTGDMSLEFQKASRGARGGILADEMGLGKTIQMAALIASNQPTKEEAEAEARERSQSPQRDRKGAKQMRQMSLAASFAVAQTSAPSASGDRRKALLASSHVHGRVTLVIAPMSLISQWRDELERAVPHMTAMLYYAESKGDLLARLEGGSVDIVITSFGTLVTEYKRYTDATAVGGVRSRHIAQVAPLFAIEWLRVILDEAHQIKNRVTRSAKACGELMAKRRWCLTGTPIVNRLSDLFSLLRFLRVEPWGDFSFFNSFVSKPFASKNPKALEVVQVILESILLRREKRTKDKDGKSIVELPKKNLNLVRLDFSPLERRVYEAVYRRAYTQYQSMAATGTVSKNFSFIFAVLMRLRQCVCHPLLVLKRKGLAIRKEQDEEGAEDDTSSALGESEEEVQRLVAEYQAGEDGEDSQGGGGAQGPDPAHLEALKELLRSDDVEAECALCMEEKSETCYLPCKHSACRPCILEHIDRCEERDEEPLCPICRAGPFRAQDLVTAVSTKRRKVTEAVAGGGDDDDGELPPSTQDSQPSIFLRRNDFRSSTKLEALARHLNQLRVDEPHFKAVVFSQFTSFLDLVEVVLNRDKHAFCRLDGTTPQKEREHILREFQTSPRRLIILVSLRAGGVGLNLTAANHVWLLDCWWNAQIEDQAVDRIHRIGQTKPVHVHRYIINDSIEDRILAIQKRKTALVGAALAGTKGKDEKSEALQNLELLFAD